MTTKKRGYAAGLQNIVLAAILGLVVMAALILWAIATAITKAVEWAL